MVMDFLFGSPDQEVMDPQIKRARDFLLDQMLMQYSAGPVNVPQYMAQAPSARYSGANALLSSLGLEGVEAPDMPTTRMNGMDVYTSQPFQEQMETSYVERYPGQYDYLRSFYMDPITGEFGERSYGYVDPMAMQPVVPTGGGGGDDDGGNDDNDSWSSSPTATNYSSTGRAPTVRPRLRPTSAADTETTFGADLSRSLSDPSYDPEGTVVSRAIDRMFGRG